MDTHTRVHSCDTKNKKDAGQDIALQNCRRQGKREDPGSSQKIATGHTQKVRNQNVDISQPDQKLEENLQDAEKKICPM